MPYRRIYEINTRVWLAELVAAQTIPEATLAAIPESYIDLWRRWRERGEAAEYYRLPTWQRATVGVVYLGLAAVLALAMSATYVERDL